MNRSEHTSVMVKPFRTEEEAKRHGTAIRYSYGWLALSGQSWVDSLGPLHGWKPAADDVRPVKGKA